MRHGLLHAGQAVLQALRHLRQPLGSLSALTGHVLVQLLLRGQALLRPAIGQAQRMAFVVGLLQQRLLLGLVKPGGRLRLWLQCLRALHQRA